MAAAAPARELEAGRSFLAQAWELHHRTHSHEESDRVDALLRQAIGYRRPNGSGFDYLVDVPFNQSPPPDRRMQSDVLAAQHAALNASIARLLQTEAWEPAVVNVGDMATLRYHLRRCATGSALPVVALGCSMTEGRMSCFGKGTGACMDNGCPQLRWCGKVQRWLSLLLPCKVSVVCARRGWGSHTYAYGFEGMIARHRPAIVLSNIAHCDTTLSPVTEIYGQVKAAAEYVIRRTLALPAAFIHFQPARPLASADAAALCDDEAKQPNRAWTLELARHYRLPALSFTRAACASDSLLGPLRHWDAGCSPVAALCNPREISWPGVKCFIHPGPHVHHLMSLLFVERVLGAAHHALRAGGGPGPSPEAEGIPTVNQPEAVARHDVCRSEGTSSDFSTSCGQPTSTGGWRCYADVPGRQGWIGSGDATDISFFLPLRGDNATVIVTYVRSFENFGRARAWLDEDEAEAVELDGRWNSRTSQPFLHVLPVATLCGPTCREASRTLIRFPKALRGAHGHALHIRPLVDGQQGASRFKVVALAAC